jgi:hypothetical protein
VSGILEAHPSPGRRLKVDWPYDDGESYSYWFQSSALIGLQELEIKVVYSSRLEDMRALPRQALFQFAPTLHLLKIGHHTFPCAGAVASL